MKRFDAEKETQGPCSTVLWLVCMDCKRNLGTKDGKGIAGNSHGLCDKCFAQRMLDR